MKKLLAAVAAAGALGGGVYAVTAFGASTQQFVYGGGHYNVNFGTGNPGPARDFSIAAIGSSTNATGQVLDGLNQSGNGGLSGISITVLCYAISSTTNASGGRTAVVGGTINSGPLAGNQAVFFVQDNASPGSPAGPYDQASALYQGPSGFLTIDKKGTTCPDPNSTTVGPDGSVAVLYSDVPYGDIVVSG
jgi:hypothetical protein